MIVRLAQQQDFASFLGLAAQVEHWFGPMVNDPGFHQAVENHIHRSAALVAVSAELEVLGGLMFGTKAPVYQIHWLVVSQQQRGAGIGKALMADVTRRFTQTPGSIEAITFGADHPGAIVSGARAFYEGLGFTAAEAAAPGLEGGPRQVYRRPIP
ncbi:GNAT family N-acetyltransferase [Nocardia sp. NBC_01009]|uniref:GNAT family N-acetyltransferase n=1 Tax=Nocardia sp. NBC_01009 TaxID=2975996 RepID=UPI003869435F|nr:GNAT family N-acetyltransferase [Nocardia sp. NBC_01009]